MTTTTKHNILIWSPRILCFAYACFITLFALDAFSHDKGFTESLREFAMHLLPTFILLAMLALSWRWAWVGAAGSFVLAGLFLYWNFTIRHNVPSAVLIIAGPLLLMATLFLFSWVKRGKLQA